MPLVRRTMAMGIGMLAMALPCRQSVAQSADPAMPNAVPKAVPSTDEGRGWHRHG